MTALQRKYFSPRKRKSSSRKVMNTARRSRARRHRYYHAARRGYHRSRGIGGKFSGIIPPVLGGAADSLLSNVNLPIIGSVNGLGSTLVGWFMKSQTTRDIGLYQIGQSIPSMVGMGTSASSGLGHPRQ